MDRTMVQNIIRHTYNQTVAFLVTDLAVSLRQTTGLEMRMVGLRTLHLSMRWMRALSQPHVQNSSSEGMLQMNSFHHHREIAENDP